MRIAIVAAILCVAATSASPAIAEPSCEAIKKEVLGFKELIEEHTSALKLAVAHYKDAQKYGRRPANEFADKGLVNMRYRHLQDAHLGMAGWVGKAERNRCQPAQLFVKLGDENVKRAVRSLHLADSAFK